MSGCVLHTIDDPEDQLPIPVYRQEITIGSERMWVESVMVSSTNRQMYYVRVQTQTPKDCGFDSREICDAKHVLLVRQNGCQYLGTTASRRGAGVEFPKGIYSAHAVPKIQGQLRGSASRSC